jgi:hypothetical protein
MYPLTSPLYSSAAPNTTIYIDREGQYLPSLSSNNVDRRVNEALEVSLYIGDISFTSSLSHPYTATLQSNRLRSWDIFYTVLDSGLNPLQTGVLTSSGYAASSGTTITSGLGYIQITNPLEFEKSFVNNSGFVYFTTLQANLDATPEWTFLGVTSSGVRADFIGDARNSFGDAVSTVANLNTAVTLNEGDLVFVRQEANATGTTRLEQRFMYVYDTVGPVVEPIALLTTNTGVPSVTFTGENGLRPALAKAGDFIDILIRTNEPSKFVYNPGQTTGNVIFKSSGVSNNEYFRSGLTLCETGNTSCAVGSDQSGYSTSLFKALRPRVSSGDFEGFFNFAGLTVQDRANNSTTVNSSQFTNYTNIWIDPIAPAITSSGFNNTSIFYSGVTGDPIPTTSVTPTSGVGSTQVYLVSGILDYNFDITESFNDITSGAVRLTINLRASNALLGSGLKAGQINSGFLSSGLTSSDEFYASGLNTIPSATITPNNSYEMFNGNYHGLESGVNTLSHGFDTSGLENGLYELRIDMHDYAGNQRVVSYYIYVINPLQYVEVNVANYDLGILSVDFSTTVKVSGTLAVNDFTVTIVTTSGAEVQRNVVINTEYVISVSGKSILLSVKGTNGVVFDFRPDDAVDVVINASGVAKLFNTLDEPLVEEAANERILKGNWPSSS